MRFATIIILCHVFTCGAATDPLFAGGSVRMTAADAVTAMFDAYGRRSLDDFAIWFAPDYVFESSDPEFTAKYPRGMTRGDEMASALHLFEGRPAAADRPALPRAVRIDVSYRRMYEAEGIDLDREGPRTVVIEGMRADIELSDGSRIDTEEARHELVLVPTPSGWLIQRWTEETSADAAIAKHADRTAQAPLLRLAISAVGGASTRVLELDVELPHRGGVIDVFDVQGRKVRGLDLADLRPGRHRVSLDANGMAHGVYWARLQQATTIVTAKVVRVR